MCCVLCSDTAVIMKHIDILEYLRVARRCTKEKTATARVYVSWHYPVTPCTTQSLLAHPSHSLHYPDILCLFTANDSDMPSYPTSGFTKRSYRTTERTWTFDLDHAPRKNRRKQAQHYQQMYITTNSYCSEFRNLRQASHT